jgi:hypothetical protein
MVMVTAFVDYDFLVTSCLPTIAIISAESSFTLKKTLSIPQNQRP